MSWDYFTIATVLRLDGAEKIVALKPCSWANVAEQDWHSCYSTAKIRKIQHYVCMYCKVRKKCSLMEVWNNILVLRFKHPFMIVSHAMTPINWTLVIGNLVWITCLFNLKRLGILHNSNFVKFIYCEKVTKFREVSTVDIFYVVPFKSTVEISQILWLEYMNFRS